MSTTELKNKISKSLEGLDKEELQSAYLLVKELANQKKMKVEKPDKNALEKKLAKGIQQLDNGEGAEFGPFLQRMKQRYGSKK
ncbi:hypothetical protein [Paraflavitalea sp. CAU 1676]|uniref:hypothetical protein n=1 Tax=Paraflavitalea sp. CAU 1676 TaxID=3032598 RepID=UPI0023DBBA19|nr:hypothetical protein [Paraflavitalea sp. CAU 1676]MDF2188928.1 hypothetical protein [Paraflavitalea sp. CAU 1676]